MIGVVAQPQDHAVVRELFELFKVPWEFLRPAASYPVVLLLGSEDASAVAPRASALVIHYHRTDRVSDGTKVRLATWSNQQLPLYGGTHSFEAEQDVPVRDGNTGKSLVRRHPGSSPTVLEVGYDLVSEIHFLLNSGQPREFAAYPTLDRHIAILRDLIVANGVPLVEVRPAPADHPFIVCLTHDVDHPSLARHRCDATAAGFLWRATWGTWTKLLRGRTSWRTVTRNLFAALRFPLVAAGLARDFWQDFARRFLEIEAGLGATYFILPQRAYAGLATTGAAPAARASGYEPADIRGPLALLREAGCEIGLHGIDAWHDRDAAARERARVSDFVSPGSAGVRMHWLYFGAQSAAALDAAGFDYDSTFGYNETVGFRAGTTQPYQLADVGRLLELPLHIMDTALFYPDYLGLTTGQAMERCQAVASAHAVHGGVLTINWHDRSVLPERCWDDFYADLVGCLRRAGAWFPTASHAVAWFRRRRNTTMAVDLDGEGGLRIRVQTSEGPDLPRMCLRVYNAGVSSSSAVARTEFVDLPFDRSFELVATSRNARTPACAG